MTVERCIKRRIMRLIRINFFVTCTEWYTSANNAELAETRIARVDATEFLSDVYNSDTRAKKSLADTR